MSHVVSCFHIISQPKHQIMSSDFFEIIMAFLQWHIEAQGHVALYGTQKKDFQAEESDQLTLAVVTALLSFPSRLTTLSLASFSNCSTVWTNTSFCSPKSLT